MSSWSDPVLQNLFLRNTQLIDVRAEVEFEAGAIPNSVNLPIMRNDERAMVGTCYKEKGQEAAIELGTRLVSGNVKEQRIRDWKNHLDRYPDAEVFCFRGGLRSQISCQWLREVGFEKKPIEGGYKKLRNFFISQLEEAPLPEFVRLGGPTGSGKTRLLKNIKNHIDLEGLANHKGSAFGSQGPQPSQITFENHLALALLKLRNSRAILEDESSTIGKIAIPKRLYLQFRHSPIVLLRLPEDERIKNIYEEYVSHSTKEFFLAGLDRIQKNLGGLNYKILKEKISEGFEKNDGLQGHYDWIEALLRLYYDPLYEKDLQRQPGKVIFQGPPEDILKYFN